MDNSRSVKDTILRAVALIGLLLVLMLGAWGIILLAFNLPAIAGNVGNSIVSLFTHSPSSSNNIATLDVSAPSSVRSGSSMIVSWTPLDESNAQYAYTLTYECQNGLSVKAPVPNGQYQGATCGTPFNYVNASGKMTLVPTLSGSAAQKMTITVSATKIDDSSVVASGSVDVTVTPGSTSTGSNTNTNTGGSQSGSTYIPSGNTTNLYGYADLSVRILSINSLSSVQGRTVVQFEVTNGGTNVAPSGWMISATLPVGYLYTYNSQTQQALYPGDKIVYTLTYDRAYNNYNYPYNNQYNYNYQNPNQNYYPYQGQYGTPSTCYRYDGYQNIPITCTDADGNVIYNNNYTYVYNQYGSYSSGVVTITADPRNYIIDQNRSNNTASIAAPIY